MTHVVIIGAGGHGREVADILHDQVRAGANFQILGFIDENHCLHQQTIDGLPVLGDWTWFKQTNRAGIAVISAVGIPHLCQRIVQRAMALNLTFVSAVSPLAHISSRAQIGRGVVVFPGVVVNTGARLGDYSIVNVGATVSHDTAVGCYSNINPGVHLAGNVTIGEGCYIGMGTSVIQGRNIGAWTVVGAGATVIHDLSEYVTAVGVPATVIKTHKVKEV